MTFQTTATYAALLTLGYLVLSYIVSARRGATGISILHGEDVGLALWIRRHGNFAEYIPLALILMGLCEARGLSVPWLHTMGVILVVSRVVHVAGLDAERPTAPMRVVGGVATQLVMLAAAAWLSWTVL